MTLLRHPNILPVTEVEVDAERVAAYLAAGWLPVADEAPESTPADEAETPTPAPSRRSRRQGTDSTKETAE